jgi:hypothetical protein
MDLAAVALNVAIALDQAANCLWYVEGDGWGLPDEMISARAFRVHLQGLASDRPMRLINGLFFWQRDHCYRAWRTEVERAQTPSHYQLEIAS